MNKTTKADFSRFSILLYDDVYKQFYVEETSLWFHYVDAVAC